MGLCGNLLIFFSLPFRPWSRTPWLVVNHLYVSDTVTFDFKPKNVHSKGVDACMTAAHMLAGLFAIQAKAYTLLLKRNTETSAELTSYVSSKTCLNCSCYIHKCKMKMSFKHIAAGNDVSYTSNQRSHYPVFRWIFPSLKCYQLAFFIIISWVREYVDGLSSRRILNRRTSDKFWKWRSQNSNLVTWERGWHC